MHTRTRSFSASVTLILPLLLIVHVVRLPITVMTTQRPCNCCAQGVGVWHGFNSPLFQSFVGFPKTQHCTVLCLVSLSGLRVVVATGTDLAAQHSSRGLLGTPTALPRNSAKLERFSGLCIRRPEFGI